MSPHLYGIQLYCLTGTDAGVDVGPVISAAAKTRILNTIQSAVDEGANVLLDGRNIVVSGYEDGYFIGPTILTDVKVIAYLCDHRPYLASDFENCSSTASVLS